MKILSILTAHTTPLQTFGLALYIGLIMAMLFIERKALYYEINLSQIWAAMIAFMMGITIFSFDMDKANINVKTATVMTVIGLAAMMTPLIVEAVIEKLKIKRKIKRKEVNSQCLKSIHTKILKTL